MSFYPVQAQNFKLQGAGVNVAATTMKLVSFTQIDGTKLTMADFGAKGYLTIEPGVTNEEQISFTGITQNSDGTATLTGIKSVGFVTPFTETSGFSKIHVGGTVAIITNTAGFYSQFATKSNAESITGTWTFAATNWPVLDTSTATPTLDAQLATKHYVDSVAIAGAATAGTNTLGIVKLSTAAVVATSPIVVGDNDTRVPTQAQKDALAGTSGTPSSTNKYVTNDDTTGTGSVIRNSVFSAYSNSVFGTGSDGSVTINSGAFSSGPITSNVLTRDAFFDSLTINSTYSLNPAGYRMFVKGTLTVNGTIARNGGAGTAGSAGASQSGTGQGAGGAGGTSPVALAAGTIRGALTGGNGGNGGNGGSSGNNGSAGTAETLGMFGTATTGGAGGNGGDSGGGSSGALGATTLATSLNSLFIATNPYVAGSTIGTIGSNSGGGGGGGGLKSGQSGAFGGGGGGGGAGGNGGLIIVAAKNITVGGSGSITVTGGAGGNGGVGGTATGAVTYVKGGGGGGGGAGGNGGAIALIYSSYTNNGTVSVAGGAKGTGGTGGAASGGTENTAGSAGSDGNNGTEGTIYLIQV